MFIIFTLHGKDDEQPKFKKSVRKAVGINICPGSVATIKTSDMINALTNVNAQ
jgi:hypothetical protein